MDRRLAQSPLRLSAGFGGSKPSRSDAKYRFHEVDVVGPKKPATGRKRRLQPLPSMPSEPPPTPPTEKAKIEFEAALLRRDFQRVLWLIENGDVPASYETCGGETALLAAIGSRHEDAFRLVMQCGVSIDCRSRHGYTPLMKAIAAAAPSAESSPSQGLTSATKRQPLEDAAARSIASNNRPERDQNAFDNTMVSCVLAHHPDLHIKDAAGRTAFDWATRTRNSKALALLHAHQMRLRMEHADFDDHDSRRGECVALLRRHEELAREMELLLRVPLLVEAQLMGFLRGIPPDMTPQAVADALQDLAALGGDSTSVAPVAKEHVMDRETRDGWTPLTKAAACGFVGATELLLALGADATRETSRLKHTPLTWASYCGHEGVVLALLRVPGLAVQQQTWEGKTALMHAVANRKLPIVRHLLHAMHDRSVRRASGKETFHAAERALLQLHSPTRRPSRWGKRPISTPGGKRKPGTEEWHEIFLEMLLAVDSSGRDARTLAKELDDGNEKEEEEASKAIREELQHAFERANHHATYVATHQARTMPTPCRFAVDGCEFVAPLDLLPGHELHACTKRRVECERCGQPVAFQALATHDRLECERRLVSCMNRQHGCELLVPVQDGEGHARDHCRKRLVRCRLGCGNDHELRYDERNAHETKWCVLRLVKCSLQCGAAPFPANQSGHHKRKVCSKRLIKCTGGRTGTGGCGCDVRVDQMDFHVVSLCDKRRVACKWASHGCAATVGGAADSRRHHEDAECPFRFVACKNAGCSLSGQLLACFTDEHLNWQCSVEHKTCPNNCDQGLHALLPAHALDAHTQSESGDCAKRLTRCRIDLCGKTLRLFDSEATVENRRMTSDASASASAGTQTRVSMRALSQRVGRTTAFLTKLRQRHERQSDDADSLQDEPVFYGLPSTRELLLAWLEPLHAALQDEISRVQAAKQASAVRVRVLSFSDETQLHLLEFQRDGHSEWLDLHGREYDVEQPTSSAVATTQKAPAMDFHCGFLAASELAQHEAHKCELRLLPCPLACGQRLVAQSIAAHLAKRCNLRNAKCRLGCGAVLPFLSLNEHEEAVCPQRQVHCDHCHMQLAHRALAVHLDKHCTLVPRRCRFGCSAKIPTAQFASHEAHECPKRLVACEQCAKQVWHCERETHAAEECVVRVFGPCDAGCGLELRVNQRAHHLLYDCAMRELPCPQCHHVLQWRELAQHKLLLCAFRDVFCRRGCGAKLREIDLARHEEEQCNQRTVFCENRCGDHVAFAKLHEHLALQCPMRVVACPHGCGDQLFAYQCEAHWTRCRQRLCACGAGSRHCKRPIRLWISQRRLVRCKAHDESGLLWALKTQDEDLVAYFVQAIDNEDEQSGLNSECANGFSPLAIAASLGNLEIAKTLLRVGADVNLESSRGRTPLMEATLARDPGMVALLLENRASVAHRNRHGQSVLAVAESFAASEPRHEQSNATRVLELLKDQLEMEQDQRALFTAIACSDYDYVARLLKHSSGVKATSAAQLEELKQRVSEKKQAFASAQAELDDSVTALNESIATTETKTTQTTRMRERVDDCKSQISAIESVHESSVAESNALEAEVLGYIREITALDIAQLLNIHTPPAQHLVVMKSICLFCGVVPRGRHHASEYTDLEWWKTAQALLMDRTLLSKLRGYRSQEVTSDVMAKVRRECLRTNAFAATTKQLESVAGDPDASDERPTPAAGAAGAAPAAGVIRSSLGARLPRRNALRGNIVGILATWVQGVEIEYKAKSERQTLTDRRRRLGVSLNADEHELQAASFEMQVATRSLPVRQEEVQAVEAKVKATKRELVVATERLRAYKLLQFPALNGHTALSFACGVGNEAMVHMLLTHGACGGPLPEEREACAALIQLAFREYLFQSKQKKLQKSDPQYHTRRSDEAAAALVRNVAQTFLLGHYRRRRRMVLYTHRVPLDEAVYNGHPQIVEILLAQGDAKLWHKTHIFPIRAVPGSTSIVMADAKSAHQLKRRGGWTLIPLTGVREPRGDQETKEVNLRDVEARLAPMTVEETLRHAVDTCDSRIFLSDRGGWTHDQTRYSETIGFLDKTLTRLHAAQEAQLRELKARKNVARKTMELQALHAQLEAKIGARDFHAISQSLDDGAFADHETTRDGLTALMAACVEEQYVMNADGQHVLAVSFLMDRSINHPFVNFESSTGNTALNVAAVHGATLCAQELVERGANVNQATRCRGETALMVAAGNGQTKFVEFLLHHKDTDVFLQDLGGKTALDHAKAGGFHDAQHVLGAAMSGGNRGRVFSSESALYGVCKWGCGYMTATHGHVVGDHAIVLQDVDPLSTHERDTCPKRIVECPLRCQMPTLWAEALDSHLNHECPHRQVACSQPKCSAVVVANRHHIHDTQECEFRPVLCKCGERMSHQKHVLHAKNSCPQRLVPCPNACLDGATNTVTLIRCAEFKTHDRSECQHRRVRCRNGCVASSELLAKDRELHETQWCPLRRVRCKWGCDEDSILAHALVHHETDECLQRVVACPTKCGTSTLLFVDLETHLSTDCARRMTLCPLGCGRKVALHTMESHVVSACRKRTVVCAQCGASIVEMDMAVHAAAQCPLRLATCALCGQSDLPHTQMATHRSDMCRMRVVACRWNCYATQPLRAHHARHHEQFECAFRPMFCPLGCGETMVAYTLRQHEKICDMRIVSCGNGCGVELRERERQEHERTYCSASAKVLGGGVRGRK